MTQKFANILQCNMMFRITANIFDGHVGLHSVPPIFLSLIQRTANVRML